MNDRQRVEAALFPVWLLNILKCGVNDKDTDDYRRCQSILASAVDEAFKGCDEWRRAQLLRRVARVHNQITEDFRVFFDGRTMTTTIEGWKTRPEPERPADGEDEE